MNRGLESLRWRTVWPPRTVTSPVSLEPRWWEVLVTKHIAFDHSKWPPLTDLQRPSEVTSHVPHQLPTAVTPWPLTVNLQTGGFLGDPCRVAGLAGIEASIGIPGLPQL